MGVPYFKEILRNSVSPDSLIKIFTGKGMYEKIISVFQLLGFSVHLLLKHWMK